MPITDVHKHNPSAMKSKDLSKSQSKNAKTLYETILENE
jgi:hypothetical protein